MKIALPAYLLLICGFFIACGSQHISSDRNITSVPKSVSKNCPFKDIKWMKVTSTYNVNTVSNFASQIGAAAAIDAKKLDSIASGSVNGNFDDSLGRVVSTLTTDSAQVSQEFYQEYLKQQSILCGMYYMMKDKDFKNDTSVIKRVRDQFFSAAADFKKIADETEKKNQ